MLPIRSGKFLLPKTANMHTWAVIACDQHSANPDYWQALQVQIGDGPSTLHFIYPEAYLGEPESERACRLEKIHCEMKKTLENGLLEKHEGVIFLERVTSAGRKRYSLLVELDLEAYSFTNPEQATVLPSEATVPERIPPRLAVRRGAPLELSHVQLLFNDPSDRVFSQIKNATSELQKLYDFNLNNDGGSLRGWLIPPDSQLWKSIQEVLESQKQSQERHFDFLVGDGNHSLACAKAYWDELKSTGAADHHPARYAAVELLNLYDSGLDFEPIHRLLEHTSLTDFARFAEEYQLKAGFTGKSTEMKAISGDEEANLNIIHGSNLAVNTLQEILDAFMATYYPDHPEYLEYIHDEAELKRLSTKDNVGIVVKGLARAELFPYVGERGATARKTFSLGHAADKRYYVELRDIRA